MSTRSGADREVPALGTYPWDMPARRTDPRARVTVTEMAALAVGGGLMVAGTVSIALHAVPSLQLVHRYAVMATALIPLGVPAFAGAAVIFATARTRWARPATLAALAGVALTAWWTTPYWPTPAKAQATGADSVTLLTMNLRCISPGMTDLASVAERARPDVVVVQGLLGSERESLADSWSQLLPHSTFHPMPDLPECGTFVFSTTPLRTLSGPGDAQPVVEVGRPGGPFVLLPVDLPTPTTSIAPWVDGFTHLSDAVAAHRGSPLVAAGDFNAVREHAPMRQLLEETGLRDAATASGNGWTPTFPSQRWHPPVLSLDHVLISADLGASVVRTQAIEGQEHLALLVVVDMADGQTP